MSSIKFIRMNTTVLEQPIEIELCKVPTRLLPTTATTTTLDLEDAMSMGFTRGTPLVTYNVTTNVSTTIFPTKNVRYYLESNNYLQVDNIGRNFEFKWGYDYKNVPANSLLCSRISVTSTSQEKNVEFHFYTNGLSCYMIRVAELTASSDLYKSGWTVSIRLINLGNYYIPYIEALKEFFYGESLFEKDTSSINGGQGNYNNISDSVGLPPLPLISPIDCGMFSMYAPTKTQLQEFSNYLWSNNIFDNLPKLFQDPMQAILNLSIIPVEFPLSTAQNIVLGNLDTNINALTINNQFYEIDFGIIDLTEFWGSALDYDKTSIEIFLPFIAKQNIDVKDIMNCNINLKYRIDLLTGVCCAFLIVQRENTTSVLYQWNGNCSVQIPLTAQNFSQKLSTLIGVGASVLGGAIAMSNPTTAGFGLLGLSNAPALLTQQQTQIQKIGSFQMESSYLGIWTPFITITRPKQSFASGYPHFKGFPSNITEIIGNVSGYCEIDTVHLENIPATSDELTEIENILKSGFII